MTDVFLLISNSCDRWISYILVTYFPSTITAMWRWQWELPISKSEAQSLLAFLGCEHSAAKLSMTNTQSR